MDASRHTRQHALLEAECNRSQQNKLLGILRSNITQFLGKKKPEVSHLFSAFRRDIPLPAKTPTNLSRQQEILGSTALETPSVEPVPASSTSRYGPIGSGRVHRYPSKGFQAFVPTLPSVLSPSPVFPQRVPDIETLFGAWRSLHTQETEVETRFRRRSYTPSSSPSVISAQDLNSSEELSPSQAYFSTHGLPQRAVEDSGEPEGRGSRATVPPFRPLPRHVMHAEPEPLHPSPLPIFGVSLFNIIDLQLDQLDGTTFSQQKVWEQLRVLDLSSRFSEAIPTLVECLVDHGITRGCPSNVHIANFCGYLLDRISAENTSTRENSFMGTSEKDVRRAFLETFKQSWATLPKPGSLSFKFLMRVASFYGHLYSADVLNEADFKECITFLAELSPLPQEGLRALISGDIEGHQLLAV